MASVNLILPCRLSNLVAVSWFQSLLNTKTGLSNIKAVTPLRIMLKILGNQCPFYLGVRIATHLTFLYGDKLEEVMKPNHSMLIVLLLISEVSWAGMCPDGSYVSSDRCTMAPNGSYVGGDRATMAPDGSYVGGSTSTMAPDGSYVEGNKATMAPDGSYVGGNRAILAPNGSYIGGN
jgi:hypothetical protein